MVNTKYNSIVPSKASNIESQETTSSAKNILRPALTIKTRQAYGINNQPHYNGLGFTDAVALKDVGRIQSLKSIKVSPATPQHENVVKFNFLGPEMSTKSHNESGGAFRTAEMEDSKSPFEATERQPGQERRDRNGVIISHGST